MSRDAVEDFIEDGRTNPSWECDYMPEINPFEGFIRIRDAVPLTGKSLFTLRKYCRDGRLTKYLWGRDVFLSLDQLRPRPAPKPKRRTNGK